MTDLEFEIIDQLYFVTAYPDLLREVDLSDEIVRNVLWDLMNKGWVKCFVNPEKEVSVDKDEYKANYSNYHYLASKKGLFEHNAI